MGLGTILKLLGKLDFQQSLRLFGLLLRHPIFSVMTLFATLKTFKISEKKFPKTHHQNGRGNAFRHALWCSLIMMYCCKVSSPRKSLKWCKAITDMHEDLFINEPLLRAMDLHNNQIGMDVFMEMLKGVHRQFFETLFFKDLLFEQSKNAKLVASVEEIMEVEAGQMVIIEDID